MVQSQELIYTGDEAGFPYHFTPGELQGGHMMANYDLKFLLELIKRWQQALN